MIILSKKNMRKYSSLKRSRKFEMLYSSIQHKIPSPDWVTSLPSAQNKNTKQLFIAAGMGTDKSTAAVFMHIREKNGEWQQILSSPAFIGLNGMCLDSEHKEGSLQTPIGIYKFDKAFGIADDPDCAIPYTKIDNNAYWSCDEREGMHYNKMVDIKYLPDLDTEKSEHLIDYKYQYRYCLNISFNDKGELGKGSAIFLHCIGAVTPYTGGCIAIPENIMKMVMQNVCPDCIVVIDTLENMHGTLKGISKNCV